MKKLLLLGLTLLVILMAGCTQQSINQPNQGQTTAQQLSIYNETLYKNFKTLMDKFSEGVTSFSNKDYTDAMDNFNETTPLMDIVWNNSRYVCYLSKNLTSKQELDFVTDCEISDYLTKCVSPLSKLMYSFSDSMNIVNNATQTSATEVGERCIANIHSFILLYSDCNIIESGYKIPYTTNLLKMNQTIFSTCQDFI